MNGGPLPLIRLFASHDWLKRKNSAVSFGFSRRSAVLLDVATLVSFLEISGPD
jgi:hypothetical protein